MIGRRKGDGPAPVAPTLLCLLAAGPAVAQVPGDTVVQRIPGTDVTYAMAYVPGGSFRLGSPEGEPGRDADEGPRRTVVLEPFWMGIHEVTSDEYAVFRRPSLDSEATADPARRMDVDAVTRPSPPYEDPAHGMGGGDRPAAGMTWWAALQYARWLSEKTGRLYRLPTEAEWEYACRAGTDSTHPAGGSEGTLEDVAWFADNSGERTHPVGGKEPNAWGLHDMAGNVAEWTLDEYREDFYASLEEGATEPWARPTTQRPRTTVRGGAFDDQAAAIRCAERLPSTPAWQRRDPQLPKSRWWNTDAPHVGFRLVSPAREYALEEIRAYWDELLES
ncbi:MAG TPA: SUMF1/EgtB/PvdO family nonheme iron enzyme [Longimicrobiales bacterium]|nr:SUMF1/EgtB/PvdO family nonheme iron enzyme [Longimicrobiales bacterium]